jgi:hypothetical protein
MVVSIERSLGAVRQNADVARLNANPNGNVMGVGSGQRPMKKEGASPPLSQHEAA